MANTANTGTRRATRHNTATATVPHGTTQPRPHHVTRHMACHTANTALSHGPACDFFPRWDRPDVRGRPYGLRDQSIPPRLARIRPGCHFHGGGRRGDKIMIFHWFYNVFPSPIPTAHSTSTRKVISIRIEASPISSDCPKIEGFFI